MQSPKLSLMPMWNGWSRSASRATRRAVAVEVAGVVVVDLREVVARPRSRRSSARWRVREPVMPCAWPSVASFAWVSRSKRIVAPATVSRPSHITVVRKLIVRGRQRAAEQRQLGRARVVVRIVDRDQLELGVRRDRQADADQAAVEQHRVRGLALRERRHVGVRRVRAVDRSGRSRRDRRRRRACRPGVSVEDLLNLRRGDAPARGRQVTRSRNGGRSCRGPGRTRCEVDAALRC